MHFGVRLAARNAISEEKIGGSGPAMGGLRSAARPQAGARMKRYCGPKGTKTSFAARLKAGARVKERMGPLESRFDRKKSDPTLQANSRQDAR